LRRAEGGTKIFGVFRVKNHDFTPKNHIFFNFRGGWTIFTNVHSINKNTIYTYKYNLLNWFFIHLR
jgi:hypothetical protein